MVFHLVSEKIKILRFREQKIRKMREFRKFLAKSWVNKARGSAQKMQL
jgi:hypothetical protein